MTGTPAMAATSIGIHRRHWRNAVLAARRAQARRDELEIETLLDEAGVHDEEERAKVSGKRCAECRTMILVDADYVPYATARVLICGGCLEDDDREPTYPGAIVRDWRS